jgi:hypothetical protein
MRCQKVRSYLSAYCNEELIGSAMRKVSDHLTTCEHCRAEEASYRELKKGANEILTYRVSEGFNNRLLDRIAKERFAETRTKAYFPKAAPSILLRRVVPIFVTACLAVAIVVTNFNGNGSSPADDLAVADKQTDDSYRTVQPTNNPNLASMMHKGWTLNGAIARSDRINRISQQLTLDLPFDYYGQSNAVNVANRSVRPTPYLEGFYRIHPVIVIFESAKSNSAKEAEVKY